MLMSAVPQMEQHYLYGVEMKIYLGSKNIKPVGFKTLDISPECNPDIVADITDMPQVPDESCSELIASHVLEHLCWPKSFKALAEMARVLKVGGVLKIAVPDLRVLLRMMESHGMPFFAAGMIFGQDGENFKDQHHFGFTAEMLLQILKALGFSDFDWWNSTLPEGANGWRAVGQEKVAISLNIQAIKKEKPYCNPDRIYELLKNNPLEEFERILSLEAPAAISDAQISEPMLYQRIHFKLIDATQRIAFLEKMLDERK